MESRIKVAGHAVHPVLVMFPLGLLPTAVVFDMITLISGSSAWSLAAFYMMAAGIVGALVAAIPGTLDWFAIPKHTRAKRLGAYHGIANVIVAILFITAWYTRVETPGEPPASSLLLSSAGVALALVSGWLGGELVGRLGVGVDDGANLDAPSSLTHESARR